MKVRPAAESQSPRVEFVRGQHPIHVRVIGLRLCLTVTQARSFATALVDALDEARKECPTKEEK
ncbi:hypothetical protein LH935_16355 [Gordonia polyisoprenivorans]|uniref:hypothetical protein n=1 Tax=Gordonia polyisoprenivorans TaxID=84595 RepID=UPI002234D1B7|nr:hypothetical protein LH935_16355 [Gordonia polyisoprenivorans]